MRDTFRKKYSQDGSLKQFAYEIKDLAGGLEEHIEGLMPSRERSLAITKLEECVMWATKAVYNDKGDK